MGGFHKWGVPLYRWMVFMENPNLIAGWFKATPILGNLHPMTELSRTGTCVLKKHHFAC